MRQLRHREVKWLKTRPVWLPPGDLSQATAESLGAVTASKHCEKGASPCPIASLTSAPISLVNSPFVRVPSTPVNAPRMTPENWPSKMKCMFDQYPDNITMEGGEGKLTIWHIVIPRPFKLPVPRWSTSGEQGAIRSSIWWKCWFQK